MNEITDYEDYEQAWEDYFTYVNIKKLEPLYYTDDLYIAYGFHNQLPIEDISEWYEDAEYYFVNSISPESYIIQKYDDSIFTGDDVDYFVEKELAEEMLYEVNGYWFRA